MAITFEGVRKIALGFEGAEEGTSYGTAAFKVRGALFVRLKEDGETLVVRVDREHRPDLLEGDPETYFITDHYLNYPWVLVRMARIHPGALRDLLRGAWRLASAEKRRAPRKRRTR